MKLAFIPAACTLTLSAAAWGQSYQGNTALSALCGTSETVPHGAAGGSRTLIATCPTPGGGVASINQSGCDWFPNTGDWDLRHGAITDFFGTPWNGGVAESQGFVTITCNDLVFTDTNNPGRRDFELIQMNFLIAITQSHLGRSNCSPFEPVVGSDFQLQVVSCGAGGSRYYDFTSGETSAGVISVADPVDGTPVPHVTTRAGAQLGVPLEFRLTVNGDARVTYCQGPGAEHGEARAGIRFRLPCDGPVFNLGPGITVNSGQLGIVNNRWIGAVCCPADFNGDGFLDFFDADAFVQCFEGGGCPPGKSADFNGDGFTDFFDVDAFIAGYEAGC